MSLSGVSLPKTLAESHAIIAALQGKFDALEGDFISLESKCGSLEEAVETRDTRIRVYEDELYAKTLHIEKLKMQLVVLRRAQFGRPSEKLDRERIEHEAACVCPDCGGTRLTRIGTDEREVLEYVPSHFKVIVHARPKMACRDCENITQRPMPSLPIEKGMPGPSLLAHVLIAKYCDHLPLYRQSGIYAREGVDLERSTLAGWVGAMSALLTPLVEAIARHVKAGSVLYADETPLPVLSPGRGKTQTARLWTLVRDERPFGSTMPPAVCYRYSSNRKAEHAEALLKGCTGYLHADGYAGFERLYEGSPVTGKQRLTEVACWAHARRKFYDVHEVTKSPAAKAILEQISKLFAVDADIKGLQPDWRKQVREDKSLPLLHQLKPHLEELLDRGSKKSPLALAIRYVLSRWPSFTCYTTDGRLEMTNNAAERAIRPLALGRKNWLFGGSDSGGNRAATIYIITETAKLNGLDPEAYLRDVISCIAQHPINKIDEPLPWRVR